MGKNDAVERLLLLCKCIKNLNNIVSAAFWYYVMANFGAQGNIK